MEGITIVNESSEAVRLAIFRRRSANGGVALVWRVVEVAGDDQTRVPAEHYALSLLYQLPTGYGRSKVVSFPGPPARFEVRQKLASEAPYLSVLTEDLSKNEVRVENAAEVPVQVFLYREDREISRSQFLDPGEEFAYEARPDLYLAVVEALHPGDELPPGAQDQAVRIRNGQTARVGGAAGGGLRILVE